MSASNHTPGPWSLNADERHPWVVECPVKGFPELPGKVCDVGYLPNARLIAAAPDLLAALKDAMRSARKDFKHGDDGDRQHQEAYAEQFAAMAKAEGNS